MTDERCPTCGRKYREPYKPRPTCQCGGKQWLEYYDSVTDKIKLRCKRCGKEAEKR